MENITLTHIIQIFTLVLYPVLGWIIWRLDVQSKRLDNTFSKEETKELINLHIAPLKESLDKVTAALDRNTETLQNLQIKVAESYISPQKTAGKSDG